MNKTHIDQSQLADQDRELRFGPKVSQIGSKSEKSGTFEDNFSVHFGSVSFKYSKVADLSHFRPKYDSIFPFMSHPTGDKVLLK